MLLLDVIEPPRWGFSGMTKSLEGCPKGKWDPRTLLFFSSFVYEVSVSLTQCAAFSTGPRVPRPTKRSQTGTSDKYPFSNMMSTVVCCSAGELTSWQELNQAWGELIWIWERVAVSWWSSQWAVRNAESRPSSEARWPTHSPREGLAFMGHLNCTHSDSYEVHL